MKELKAKGNIVSWADGTKHPDICLSEIYSRLIKDTRVCEKYQSDVFYDLQHIQKCIDGLIPKTVYLAYYNQGIHSGTDYDFVKYACCSRHFFVYACTISVDEENREITVTLRKEDE